MSVIAQAAHFRPTGVGSLPASAHRRGWEYDKLALRRAHLPPVALALPAAQEQRRRVWGERSLAARVQLADELRRVGELLGQRRPLVA